MSAALFFAPQSRVFTASGSPSDGAYWQFYVTQSTTPADVFANADLTGSLGNVVTADADGQFIAFYMDSAVTYRVQLYDKNDILIDDVDPYLPVRDFAPGTVQMWFGAAIDLETYYPSALWQICDGTNSSPDLQGRFPLGVGAGFAVNDSGGAVSGAFTTSTDGEHIHSSVTSGAHALSISELPVHDHGVRDATSLGPSVTPGYVLGPGADTGVLDTKNTGSGATHTHPAGIAAVTDSAHAHTGTVDTMPPYRAIYFVMRRFP